MHFTVYDITLKYTVYIQYYCTNLNMWKIRQAVHTHSVYLLGCLFYSSEQTGNPKSDSH